MRLALVLGVIGKLLRMFCWAFLPPLMLCLWDGYQGMEEQFEVASHFGIAWAVTLVAGLVLARGFPENANFRRTEALAVVAGTWFIAAHFAAIPYILGGLNYVDAFFESMSGFTTTGATILTDFAAYGRGFFLWRSMTQWFGGLGVIALFVVVLPQLGIAGRQLFFAESSTAPSEVISSRVRDAARRLWILYLFLSLAMIGLLWLWAGMPLYETICHTATTLAAGGFSPHPASISGYADPTTLLEYSGSSAAAFSNYNFIRAEWIFILFMIVAGTSFPLLWLVFTRRPRELFRDDEFRFYFLSCLALGLGCAWILSGGELNADAIRTGTFQSASLISSTGYASTDYNLWPASAKILLIVAMFVGGCAGSAAGGAKAIRNLLVFRFMGRELKRSIMPNAVVPLRYKGRSVSDPILRSLVNVVGLYLLTYCIVGVVLVLLGTDLITGFTAALACVGNIGPGMNSVGPMANFAELPDSSKMLLTFGMWAGRLEMVTVLALLQPLVWKRLRWRGIESGMNP